MGHQIDLVIENQGIAVAINEVDHLAQGLIHQARIVADAGDPQRGALPVIKTVHLGDGDIEAALDSIFDALDNPTFALERAVARDAQFDAAGSDRHALKLC